MKNFVLCLLCMAVLLFSAEAVRAETEGTGISLSVFTANLKAAAKKVEYPLSEKRIDNEILSFGNGSFAIDYNEAIQLFFNSVPDTKMLKNAAVSYTIGQRDVKPQQHFGRGQPDADDEFESLCLQLIISLEPQTPAWEAKELLKTLGIGGPALDGKQRQVRRGRLAYIMKLQGGSLLLVASGI